MAGRIPDRDIAAIRERTRIEDIVGDYVQLKRAGADSLKGLCPFHDEKSPSFHVRPNHGHFHCFGCGEGGDAYTFIQKIEHITFVEAVERLADRIGYTINYEGGGTAAQRDRGTRARLVAANAAAQEFYAAALDSPEAAPARQYLTERNFDGAAAKQYGCGFAPSGWDTLTKHLMRKGFEFKELEAAGLSREGRRGPMDRFHRRLLWPIRASSGEVIGFGARKIFDDDTMPGKYVNTPETMLYKKSSVLFGLDLAKRDIAKGHQAVVVEGYTDVMAMHLAGVTTAVASCGTAFGDEHLSMLRRLMMDDSYFRGELIYVFDGDAAGQAAALKAFEGEQNLAGQSFVAVAPDGMDPCDLRLKSGEGRCGIWSRAESRFSPSRFGRRWRSPIWRSRRAAWTRCAGACRWSPRSRTPRCATSTPVSLPAGSAGMTWPRCWRGCVRRPARRPRAALCPRIVVPVAPRRRRHPRCRCPIPRTPRCGRSAKLSRPRCSSRPSPVRCSTR
ncbi:DNA primase [Mycobacteroides abscessus 21]|uniref:DNA primase n=1 Tax=Mycobacteroides abscessus 21 TaxID=1299324 RepID=A0A829Q703_9MYCO|nr:DNA primase [Mycobacteroides abscessus 21]